MLSRIEYYLDNELDLEILYKEISQIIQQAIDKNDTKILDDFFGSEAFQNNLTKLQLQKLNEEFKEHKIDSIKYLQKHLTTTYLHVGLYLACLKGSIPIAKYFFEKQKILGNVTKDFSSYQKYFAIKDKLKGPPLTLAVKSGNISLVKYIYENTNAMVETCLEQPMEPTALMIAVESGYDEIVEYLLEHGGNPNSQVFAENNQTPLSTAIRNQRPIIVKLLVNAGAIVTAVEINLALRCGSNLQTIEFLLNNCINSEDLYHPYLLSAIQSGDIALLKSLETHPLISSYDKIFDFNEKPIDEKIIHSASRSGQVGMMKYFVAEKKLDLKKIVTEECKQVELKLEAKTKGYKDSIERIHNINDTVLTAAYYSGSVPLLHYLFEEQNLKPSTQVIQEICAMDSGRIQPTAYLISFLEASPDKITELRSIAFDLTQLDLGSLFKIYNTTLVRQGNQYAMHRGNNFLGEVGKYIKAKESKLTPSELLQLVRKDKQIATGALFYYCTNEFDKDAGKFMFLLTTLTKHNGLFKTVDIQNCIGESLAQFANWQHCYDIVKQLLARGANPDLPNHKGGTLINDILEWSSVSKHFEWLKSYIEEVTNTLRYASKESFGGCDVLEKLLIFTSGEVQGISIAELIENCTAGSNNRKLNILYKHLSESNAKEMMKLLQNEDFIQKVKLSKDDVSYCLAQRTVVGNKDKLAGVHGFFAVSQGGEKVKEEKKASLRV